MIGTIIGQSYKAVKANLSQFRSAPKLAFNCHWSTCRYILYTDKGNIWAPPMQPDFSCKPTKMRTNFSILNIVCADIERKTLVRVEQAWFPIEVNSGDELAVQYEVQQYAQPSNIDLPRISVPPKYRRGETTSGETVR